MFVSAGQLIPAISDRERCGGLLRARRTAGQVSSMKRALSLNLGKDVDKFTYKHRSKQHGRRQTGADPWSRRGNRNTVHGPGL
jgi:hypothetical protein